MAVLVMHGRENIKRLDYFQYQPLGRRRGYVTAVHGVLYCRVDPNAHHQALPARAVLSSSVRCPVAMG